MTHSSFSTPQTGRHAIHPVYDPAVNRIDHPRQSLASLHTTLVAVDITGFGARHEATIQYHLRTRMYEHLIEAFMMTRLPWWDCYREDRGDGALIVAPPNICGDLFLDPLAHHLTAILHRYNRLTNDTNRLRLRIAVHHGDVHHDPHGITGYAVNYLFRLLEATTFKKAFHAAGSDLALIVSDRFYTDASRRGGLINTTAYRQLRITHKETRRARAWLWIPPAPRRPRRRAVRRSYVRRLYRAIVDHG